MKKINKIILCGILIITFIFLISPSLKAESDEINPDEFYVTSSSVKDSKNQGLTFLADCSNVDISNVKKFGIIISYGKTDDLNNFKKGNIINGMDVLFGETTKTYNGLYKVTLTKIPQENYAYSYSSRAYLVVNDNIVYSNKIYTTTLYDEVSKITNLKGYGKDVKEYVDNNFVNVYFNNYGNLEISPIQKELNFENLKKEFVGDYYNMFNVDLTNYTAKMFYNELKSSKNNDLSDSNLFYFYEDIDLFNKWSFILDYFKEFKEIKSLPYIIDAITNDGTSNKDKFLHYGEELIYSLYNFFNGSYEHSLNDAVDFTIRQRYEDALNNSNIEAKAVNNNYVQVGSKIILPKPLKIATGYEFCKYNDGVTDFLPSQKYEITKEYKELNPIFKLTEYKINYYLDDKIIKTGTYTFDDMDLTLDIHSVKDYSFEGWYTNPSFTGEKVEMIKHNSTGDINLYAKIVKLGDRAFNTYKFLTSFFNKIDIVDKNLDLPTEYKEELATITWNSTHPDIISETGKLARDYKETNVTLIANVHLGERTYKYTFDFKVAGFKPLENIASGYIFNNYKEVTPLFFDTLDVIYCAFVSGTPEGDINYGSCAGNTRKYIMDKAHEKGCYVIASLGPNENWATIANPDNNLVEKFADNIVTMINTFGFDGVDIDWEHPLMTQKTWFTDMMKVIYTKVKANNPNHLVTAAIYGGQWQPPCYDLLHSQHYLDYINLMCYGMTVTKGYYQNALYPAYSFHDPDHLVGRSQRSCSIAESVDDYMNNYNVPASKLIPGFAFYAVVYTRTIDNGVYSEWKNIKSIGYTSVKRDYLSFPQYEEIFDERAGIPYILSKDKLTFISYDNPESVKAKCDYAIKKGCAGIMYWQNGQDTTDTLLSALKSGLNK